MKRINFILCAFGLALSAMSLGSCNNNDYYDYGYLRPTAVVTVRPQADGSFFMQLDDFTVIYPDNMDKSPFGDKEVRALVNYTPSVANDADPESSFSYARINWIDSIRTKQPVENLGEEQNNLTYGTDPIEIVRDWVTVAEDGYLTLRIRTRWGERCRPHIINLVGGVNPDNIYEFDLHHDAQGDTYGDMGDALIAFNLNGLPRDGGDKVTIRLNWRSWMLTYKWNYYSERYTTSSNETTTRFGVLAPYFMNDLSIEKRFSFRWAELSVKGAINNLFKILYLLYFIKEYIAYFIFN